MKVVILCGGLGSRLAEETEVRPKPMVEIGGRPMFWHIMKHYGHFGFNDFFIALGYKGEVIKRYFLDYHMLTGDMTLCLSTGKLGTPCRRYRKLDRPPRGYRHEQHDRRTPEASGAVAPGRNLHADLRRRRV